MNDFLRVKSPRIRRGVLLALAFGIPVFFLRLTNDPINIPKLALLALGVVVAGGFRAAELLVDRRWGGLQRLAVPSAAILLPLAIGWLVNDDRWWTLMGQYPRYLGLVPYALTIVFGVLIADAFGRDPRPIAWALVAAGATAGAYGLVQVADLDPLSWSARGNEIRAATATLGNTNFTGGFLAIVSPIALSLWFLEPGRRVAVGLCGAPILGGLVVSQSQGGYAAAVIGLLLTGAFLIEGRIRTLVLVVAGLGLAGVIVVVAVGIANPSSVPATIELRGRWWSAAADAVFDSPVVGHGPASFALEHSQHRTLDDVVATGSVVEGDPHSVPLSLAVGGGVLALLGFAYAMFWLLRAGYRAAQESLAAAGFLGAIGAYLTQALVSIDTVALRSAFWAAAGGLAAAALPDIVEKSKVTNRPSKAKRHPKSQPASPAVLVGVSVSAIAVMVGAYWALRLVTADARYQAASAGAGGTFEEVRADYEAALESRSEVAYRAGYGSFLAGIAGQISEQGGAEEAESLIGDASEAFSFTADLPDVRWATAHARTLRDWAATHPEASGEVVRLYQRALSLDPLNYVLYEEAAQAAEELDEEQSAAAFQERAEALRAEAGE